MTDTHYELGTTALGQAAYQKWLALARAWADIVQLRGVMIQMKDNGATGNAVFAKQAALYGYAGTDTAAQQAAAAASFAELDSMFGYADAAITQALDRHL